MCPVTPSQSLPKSLAERIAGARKRKGISQERLAEMVGTSRRHVMRWERSTGKAVAPRQEYRVKLAEALELDADFFGIDGEDDDEEADLMGLDEFLRDLGDLVRQHRKAKQLTHA